MVEPTVPSSGKDGGVALAGGIVELAVHSAEEGGETVGGEGGGSVEVDGAADVTGPSEVKADGGGESGLVDGFDGGGGGGGEGDSGSVHSNYWRWMKVHYGVY